MSVDALPAWGPGSFLIVSDSYSPLHVSYDGGHSWQARNGTVVDPKPAWWTNFSANQLLSYGRNGVIVTRANPSRWLIATGFGVAASTDGGNTWGWSSDGIGGARSFVGSMQIPRASAALSCVAEVCMFRCRSHPARANWTFCGAMDLTGFLLDDGGVSGAPA